MLTFLIAGIATLGVDVGWQPDEHGQTEYIIQLQPHQLKNLKPGDTIDVGVRPQLRNISSFQIVIGDNQLPRIGTTPKLSVASPNEQILQADHEQSVTADDIPMRPIGRATRGRGNRRTTALRPQRTKSKRKVRCNGIEIQPPWIGPPKQRLALTTARS